MVDYLTLITQMHKKGVLQPTPTQNVQMMKSEPLKEDPRVNMVLRSGIAIKGDAWKQSAEDKKGHDAPTREIEFEVEQVKKMPKEAQKSFMEVSTPGRRNQIEPGMDPSMLTTFLETCMKLLCDNGAVKGLQELITKCTGSGEPRIIRKLGRHALRTRREM